MEWHYQNTLERDILEARLLTLASYERIAAASQLSAAAIEAYEQLFFAFRPQLQAKDWITVQAIRFGMPDNTVTVGAVLRKYAFWAGWDCLEQLIRVVRKLGTGSLALNLPNLSTLDGKLERTIRLLLAVEMAPHEAFRNPKLLALGLRGMAEQQRQQAMQDNEPSPCSDEVARWLDCFHSSPAQDGGWSLQVRPANKAA